MPTLDHLPFGVRDVDAIREELGRLGFTTATSVCRWTRRGRAYEARALSIVFESAYLDLVEVEVEVGESGWDDHLRTSTVYGKGIAPSGLVLSSRALEESRARLAAAGVATGEPYGILRELPGSQPPEIGYRIFSLRNHPDLPFAFIEDSAPEAMRTEAWLRHPNSATGIRSIHLRVPSLHAVRSRLRAIFAGGPTEPTEPTEPAEPTGPAEPIDPVELDLGTATLFLHETPRAPYLDAVSSLLPRRDRAALLAIELTVANLEVTRALLARNRIPASLAVAGGLAIEPAAGYGCGVVFVPEEGK